MLTIFLTFYLEEKYPRKKLKGENSVQRFPNGRDKEDLGKG